MKFDKLKRELADPGNHYRPITFWSWNNLLTEEELRRQIREQKSAGMGGYFMHARAGLRTPYLGEEWMRAVDVCVQEGKAQGIDAYLYDEDGWPSGFAGGLIPALGEKFQQKYLIFREIPCSEAAELKHLLGIYDCGGSHEMLDFGSQAPDRKVLAVAYEVNPFYSDVLDESVVKAFLDSTYEAYFKRFREEFGREIPGIFTDEPQYGRGAFPWSFVLERAYRERYGRELIPELGLLYYDCEEAAPVRYRFFQMLAELFSKGYSGQISDWCAEHGIKLTGHVLFEDTMALQCKCSGNAMAFYRYMQIPAVDHLGNGLDSPVVTRQVLSAACQTGRKQILSEMFGGSTWGVKVADLKRIAEWQFVSGVNLMCPHLLSYSILGSRKRDWPPSIFLQMPWWRCFRGFTDYFSRLSVLSANSRMIADVLVIHPLRSAWMSFNATCYSFDFDAPEACRELDAHFRELSILLSELHYDYHYGDEELLAELGSVQNGLLRVGECAYVTVIIPQCLNLDSKTVELLEQFSDQGGRVLYLNDFPCYSNGEPADLSSLKSKSVPVALEREPLNQALASDRRVSIRCEDREVPEILHMYRRMSDTRFLYLVNTSDKEFRCTVRIRESESIPYLYDAEENRLYSLGSYIEDGYLCVRLRFSERQSRVLLLSDHYRQAEELREGWPQQALPISNLQIGEHSLNEMTLDYCSVRYDGGEIPKGHVLDIQERMMEVGRSVPVCLTYEFESDSEFKGKRMYLAVENDGRYEVLLNGSQLDLSAAESWLDAGLLKLPCPNLIRKGRNVVELRGEFSNTPANLEKYRKARIFESEANSLFLESEIEAVYLIGEFEVKCELSPYRNNTLHTDGEFVLTDARRQFVNNDLTESGYPFFAGEFTLIGRVSLARKPRRALFVSGQPEAAAMALSINGKEIKTFLWGPYEADVTDALTEGENTVEIKLYSTNRNLFGHHHHPEGDLKLLAPALFTRQNGWTDGYSFLPFGPANEIRLLVD